MKTSLVKEAGLFASAHLNYRTISYIYVILCRTISIYDSFLAWGFLFPVFTHLSSSFKTQLYDDFLYCNGIVRFHVTVLIAFISYFRGRQILLAFCIELVTFLLFLFAACITELLLFSTLKRLLPIARIYLRQ